MSRKSKMRQRHPGWIRGRVEVIFFTEGKPDPEDVLKDMKFTLDPTDYLGNIFEAHELDDFGFTVLSLEIAKKPKTGSYLYPLELLKEGEDWKGKYTTRLSWTFPIPASYATLDQLIYNSVDSYLKERGQESRYLENGYAIHVKKALSL